jgi:hypothetical protein
MRDEGGKNCGGVGIAARGEAGGAVLRWEREAEQIAERAEDAGEAGIMIEQGGEFGFGEQVLQPSGGGGGDAGAGNDIVQPAMATREWRRARAILPE